MYQRSLKEPTRMSVGTRYNPSCSYSASVSISGFSIQNSFGTRVCGPLNYFQVQPLSRLNEIPNNKVTTTGHRLKNNIWELKLLSGQFPLFSFFKYIPQQWLLLLIVFFLWNLFPIQNCSRKATYWKRKYGWRKYVIANIPAATFPIKNTIHKSENWKENYFQREERDWTAVGTQWKR